MPVFISAPAEVLLGVNPGALPIAVVGCANVAVAAGFYNTLFELSGATDRLILQQTRVAERFELYRFTGAFTPLIVTANLSAPLGQWFRYAVVWDGVLANQLRFYFGVGSAPMTEISVTTGVVDAFSRLDVGALRTGGERLDGNHGPFAVYNRSLSASEVDVATRKLMRPPGRPFFACRLRNESDLIDYSGNNRPLVGTPAAPTLQSPSVAYWRSRAL